MSFLKIFECPGIGGKYSDSIVLRFLQYHVLDVSQPSENLDAYLSKGCRCENHHILYIYQYLLSNPISGTYNTSNVRW